MFRRIVSDFAARAVIAKELSLGFYEALAFLTQGRAELEDTFADHDAHTRAALPNF